MTKKLVPIEGNSTRFIEFLKCNFDYIQSDCKTYLEINDWNETSFNFIRIIFPDVVDTDMK